MLVPLTLFIIPLIEDYNDEDKQVRRRSNPRDDLRDLMIKALEFDENVNLKNFIDRIQFMDRIFYPKEYNDGRVCFLML